MQILIRRSLRSLMGRWNQRKCIMIAFQGYADTVYLNVVDVLVYNIILGQDWLYDVDSVMYYLRYILKLMYAGQKLVI